MGSYVQTSAFQTEKATSLPQGSFKGPKQSKRTSVSQRNSSFGPTVWQRSESFSDAASDPGTHTPHGH
eukprot:5718746-Amphidinium_carterae.2